MQIPPPNRQAALARLRAFVPQAGLAYARNRNLDVPGHPHISGLSPYLRHRMLTEAEVLRAVVNAHGATAAGKFVDEVFWRTYWKGWLEMRPGIWADYRAGLARALDDVQTQAGLRQAWQTACAGETGIAGFDDWAKELVQTGYLHNHARMWFASIWIFTLRLPWELGADFFLRHLLDGDPASNTLSWRWVGGLQTKGKIYLARADNIERYTGGRIRPEGLAPHAAALSGAPHPAPRPVPADARAQDGLSTGLILTEEDMSPDWVVRATPRILATAVIQTTEGRSPLVVAPMVCEWVKKALDDSTRRLGDRIGPVSWHADTSSIVEWAHANGLAQIVIAYPPVGPTQDALSALSVTLASRSISLVQRIPPYDQSAWPRATHGFFKFREAIPRLLASH